MQVRGVDQTPVSSLGSDCQSCTAFLLKVVEKLKPQNLEKLRGGTGFTSIEMVHTHALPRQGFFALFWKSSEVTEI